MKKITILFVLFWAFLVQGQEPKTTEFFIKSLCLKDSIRIELASKEARKKNVEEIKNIKTLHELKNLLSVTIANGDEKMINSLIGDIKCYFKLNNSQISSRKIRQEFFLTWGEIKKIIQEYAKTKDLRTKTVLIHLTETTGIKEVDNINLARKAVMIYVDKNTPVREKKIDGFRPQAYKHLTDLEIALNLLIDIYSMEGTNKSTGLSDFKKTLTFYIRCIPLSEEVRVKVQWISYIGEKTNIYIGYLPNEPNDPNKIYDPY